MNPTVKPTVTLLVALLAVSAIAVGSVEQSRPAADSGPRDVFIEVRLHGNGTATWTVQSVYTLDTDNKTQAFKDLQASIRSNRSRYRRSFRDRYVDAVRRAANETGREMKMRRVTVSTTHQRVGDTGLVTYRFQWTNFSRTNDTHVVAGDAIRGFFIKEGMHLEFDWPSTYRATDVTPAPQTSEGTSVKWEGPTNFDRQEPRVVLERRPETATESSPLTDASTVGTTASRASNQSVATSGSPATGGSVPPLPAAAGATVLLLLGVLGWAYGRTPSTEVFHWTGGESGDGAGGDDGPPPDLLSNDERVLRALSEHGGRMKQKELRDQLDWPAPKTSKVLTDMREDGEVEVFRLGRENVVTLPEVGLEDDHDE